MFKFRLQRVLELREKAEQAKAREFATAEDMAEAARIARDDLARVQQDTRSKIAAAHEASPRVGHLHQLGMVINSLEERLAHAGEAVVNAESVAADARGALELAARDRRVLDRLKEKHVDAWRSEESMRDRQQMDEIALARFARARENSASVPVNGTATTSPATTPVDGERAS
jgi:flagellar protein FliJ